MKEINSFTVYVIFGLSVVLAVLLVYRLRRYGRNEKRDEAGEDFEILD
ncbi:MAG: hypothetical protein M3Q34_02495 [bacterium]|nr:hypothetical protein [bacterium]